MPILARIRGTDLTQRLFYVESLVGRPFVFVYVVPIGSRKLVLFPSCLLVGCFLIFCRLIGKTLRCSEQSSISVFQGWGMLCSRRRTAAPPPPLPESARPSPGLQNTIWPPCWRGSGAADNTEILLCSVSSQSSDTHGCLQF